MRRIPIKTTKEKFYRQFLALVSSLPPFNKLMPRELDVLAQILYQHDKYRSTDKAVRHMLIFNKDVRKEMRETINISTDIFNVNLSGLRKHGLITKDNKLAPFLENIYFNKEFKLEFDFIEK